MDTARVDSEGHSGASVFFCSKAYALGAVPTPYLDLSSLGCRGGVCGKFVPVREKFFCGLQPGYMFVWATLAPTQQHQVQAREDDYAETNSVHRDLSVSSCSSARRPSSKTDRVYRPRPENPGSVWAISPARFKPWPGDHSMYPRKGSWCDKGAY